MKLDLRTRNSLGQAFGLLCAIAPLTAAANGSITVMGPVASLGPEPGVSQAGAVDFRNATPMALPRIPYGVKEPVNSRYPGSSGYSPGGQGDGELHPQEVGRPETTNASLEAQNIIAPAEYGTTKYPFTTAQADLGGLPTNTAWPYRASGKLFFNSDGKSYICSASLIKRGIVVTAAHCVSEYGKNRFYTDFQFVPGYRDGAAPFGVWTASQVLVMADYLKGKKCTNSVVCNDDIAVIVLAPQSDPQYPGSSTGWYGYGWNGYGFAGTKTQITQIGYPSCLDNAQLMERTDSYGVKNSSRRNNTQIGSLMCGGSSGGPWLINFGLRPVLTDTFDGLAAAENTVVGVTSWGYTTSEPKQMGASPFTSNNIVPLVDTACATFADRCN